MELFIIMFFIGVLTKVVDLIEDDGLKLFRYANVLFGIIYGLLIGYVVTAYQNVSPLLLGTVIAMVVYGRIDAKGHYTGIVALALFLVANWPWKTSVPLLMIFVIANIFEELLNDLLDRGYFKKNVIKNILAVRPVLELTALVVAIVIKDIAIFMTILSYDVGYVLTGTYGLRILGKKN